MSWGMVGAAGVSVAGSMLSKDSTSGVASAPVTPEWLKGAPEEVKNRMMDLMDRESLSPEQRVAGIDPAQQEAINAMIGWGKEGGTGFDIMQSLQPSLGAYGEGFDTLSGVAGEATPQNMGVNMDNVMSYINNDVLEGQIDAAGRDVTRQFYEVDAPRSRMAQALSGNTGSTRGAIGDAILQRGTEDRLGDISGSMRGSAYNTALGIGANEAAQNASLGLGSQQLRMNAGRSLMTGGMQGTQMMSNVGRNNLQLEMEGGGMQRDYDQALRDIEYQNWQREYGDVEMANDIFNSQMNAFGGTQQTGTSAPSDLEVGAGIGSIIAGMPSWGGDDGGNQGFDPQGMVPWEDDFFDDMDWSTG